MITVKNKLHIFRKFHDIYLRLGLWFVLVSINQEKSREIFAKEILKFSKKLNPIICSIRQRKANEPRSNVDFASKIAYTIEARNREIPESI